MVIGELGWLRWFSDWDMDWTVKGLNQTVGPPSPLFIGYGGSFLGVKQPGCEADHLPSSSTKVWMSGAIPLLPLYSFVPWTGKTSLFYFTMIGFGDSFSYVCVCFVLCSFQNMTKHFTVPVLVVCSC